jgi:hypothetical protein
MKPSLVFMMRLSGSVKLRCVLPAGLRLDRYRHLAGHAAAFRRASVLRFGPRLVLRLGGRLGFGFQLDLGLA